MITSPQEYEQAIHDAFPHPQIRDAWIGNWMVKRLVFPSTGRYQYQADHTARVGATADDVPTLALRMAAWDAGLAVVNERKAA